MKRLNLLLTLAAAAMMVVPFATAQIAEPVTACDPANCDPLTANNNVVKTGDETTTIILYAHHPDLLQQAPLNTQKPSPEEEPDVNQGFLMPTIDLTTGVEVQGTSPDVHFNNNEFTWFSSPGLVEYTADGWRIHQEPGLAADVLISGGTINGYFYLSPKNAPDSIPVSGSAPGAMPNVGVFMQLETGRFFDRGDVIAVGDTGSGYRNPDATKAQGTVTIIRPPGQEAVFEFEVPMDVKRSSIPSHESAQGYVVTVIPYQFDAASPDASFTQADWRLRTGPNFPPRLVMDVENAMVSTHSLIHTFDDHLFFRWSFTSPFGSYDLDVNSLDLSASGPKSLGKADIEFVKLKHSVDHDGHFKPLNATWRYGYVDNPLPDGKYQVQGMVHNLQGTYMLVWNDEFTVVDGVPQVDSIGAVNSGGGGGGSALSAEEGGDSPGLGAAGMAVALAAGMVVAARRRRD